MPNEFEWIWFRVFLIASEMSNIQIECRQKNTLNQCIHLIC